MNVNAIVIMLTAIVVTAIVIDAIINILSYINEPKEIPDEVAARRVARDRIPQRLDSEDHLRDARRAHPAGKQRLRLLDPTDQDRSANA